MVTWEGAGPAWVDGDADHLVQLFLNLLDNALAWTPPGRHVAVTLAAAGTGWAVTVADSGPGIAAEHLSHLFERESKTQADNEAHEKQLEELYAQIGKLRAQLAWMKKNLALTFPGKERMEMVERADADLPITDQAVSISGLSS